MAAPPVRRTSLLLAGLFTALGGVAGPAAPSVPAALSPPVPAPTAPTGQAVDAVRDSLRWPPPPGDGLNAVLLQDAVLRDAPDDSLAARNTLPAGSVVGFQARVQGVYGRAWSQITDPTTQVRDGMRVLAPFDEERLERWDRTSAFLELPTRSGAGLPPDLAAALAPAQTSRGGASGDPAPPAWWRRIVPLGPEHVPAFVGTRGVDAVVVPGPVLDDLLGLLGGLAALGPFPEEPLPGQILVPGFLPLVLRFEGDRWAPTEPALLLADAPGLLGNPHLTPDTSRPSGPLGPPVPCWRLIGGRGPRGEVAGAVAVQAPTPATGSAAASARGGGGAAAGRGGAAGGGGAPGPGDGPGSAATGGTGDVGVSLQRLWPTAPGSAAVPPRLPTSAPPPEIGLRDDTYEQAVHLAQDLHPALVRGLRGRELVLEVVARAMPGDSGPASLGLAVVAGDERFQSGQSVSIRPTTVSLTFTVPAAAESLSVRILPLDVSVAVEQQGEALVERARLRPAEWPDSHRADVLLLHEVVATVWPDATRYVRAELAVTDRPRAEARRLWAGIHDRGWDIETVRAVLAGRLTRGMSTEQVLAAWGEPDRRVRGAEASGLDERWEYPDRSAAFVDGALLTSAVEPPRETAAVEPPGLCWAPPAAADGGSR